MVIYERWKKQGFECLPMSQYLICCMIHKRTPNHVFAKHQLVIQRREGRRFPNVSSNEMRPIFRLNHIHCSITKWSIDCNCNSVGSIVTVCVKELYIKVTASK
jgi:hypothetical protein